MTLLTNSTGSKVSRHTPRVRRPVLGLKRLARLVFALVFACSMIGSVASAHTHQIFEGGLSNASLQTSVKATDAATVQAHIQPGSKHTKQPGSVPSGLACTGHCSSHHLADLPSNPPQMSEPIIIARVWHAAERSVGVHWPQISVERPPRV